MLCLRLSEADERGVEVFCVREYGRASFWRGTLCYMMLPIPIVCDEAGYWTFGWFVHGGFVSANFDVSVGLKTVDKESSLAFLVRGLLGVSVCCDSVQW